MSKNDEDFRIEQESKLEINSGKEKDYRDEASYSVFSGSLRLFGSPTFIFNGPTHVVFSQNAISDDNSSKILNSEGQKQQQKGLKKMYEFHAFISYASEDKDLSLTLHKLLTEAGFDIWLDKDQIDIGDSIRKKIDDGLNKSVFVIVIFSPNYFIKNYTEHEFDGLLALEFNDGKKRLLPIWHRITKDEVLQYSPTLLSKLALKTSDMEVSEIAISLIRHFSKTIKGKKNKYVRKT